MHSWNGGCLLETLSLRKISCYPIFTENSYALIGLPICKKKQSSDTKRNFSNVYLLKSWISATFVSNRELNVPNPGKPLKRYWYCYIAVEI